MRTREVTPIETAGTQTISRAVEVLACFSAEHPHLKLLELANQLGLTQSTAYRYLTALESGGLVTRDVSQGGYRLGYKVIELSWIALNQIEARRHALDEMEQLLQATGLKINLAVLIEGDVIHVAHAVPPDVPRGLTTPGRRAVAHCTSLGKAMLADLPAEQVHSMIERYGWRPYTKASVRDFKRLDRELEHIRQVGYALDLRERRPEVLCAGASIRDYSGRVVAAVSASVRDNRYTAESLEAEVAPRVVAAAERISFRMGDQATTAAFL
jgi:IclR family transcriptional regulator, KDG regulon repressor